MYTDLLKQIDELEKLVNGLQSIKHEEMARLLNQLDKRKNDGCPIGNRHVNLVLKGAPDKIPKDKEDPYLGHVDQCPVCYLISAIKMLELEKKDWTLDKFRGMVLRQINRIVNREEAK